MRYPPIPAAQIQIINHTLTERYQVYITDTDPISHAVPYAININNQYTASSLQSQASGDDLDTGESNSRQITVGDIHYEPYEYWRTVPVNQWLSVNINYYK